MQNRRNLYLMTVFVGLVSVFSSSIWYIAEGQTSERCNEGTCNVLITEEGFVPKTLFVQIGTTVVWTNMDDSTHTVTSGSPGEIVPPLKSSLLKEGETYEFTFDLAGQYKGTYKYFDQVKRTLRGEIIVEPEVNDGDEEPLPPVKTFPIDFTSPDSGVTKVSFPTGLIKSMETRPSTKSLIISIEKTEFAGKMEISLARTLIDSKLNGADDNFLVIVDDHEGFFDEISSTSTERTLQIAVPHKTMRVEIIGSQVVPEFPIGIFITMALVIGTALAVTRFRDFPR